jgi:xylulokinase
MALEIYPHSDPRLWVIGGSITSAGSALAWAADKLGFSGPDEALSLINEQSNSEGNPSLIFLPHLFGERCPNWVPQSLGAWIGLNSMHSASDLMISVLEGVAFALKSILVRVESLAGAQKQIRVVRREREAEGWIQLRASIYERPLGVISTPEPTGLGAMILASVALGIYQDLEEAVDRVTQIEQIVSPDPELISFYERKYTNFEIARNALIPYWRQLGVN